MYLQYLFGIKFIIQTCTTILNSNYLKQLKLNNYNIYFLMLWYSIIYILGCSLLYDEKKYPNIFGLTL